MNELINVHDAQNLYNQFKEKMQDYAILAMQLEQTHPICAKKYETRAETIARELYNVWVEYRNIVGYDLNTQRIA